jgi:uncharacterized membrane protein SpoIIM required for sporulation
VPGPVTLLRVDLDAYVAEHAGEWRRLEHLAGRRKLSADEVDELVALYQRAATHLSVVRSRSPDPALIAKLSRLVLTARGAVTGGSAFSWRSVGKFFTATFPLAVYRAWPWWSAVAVAFSAISFGVMAYVAGHPDVALLFMSQGDIDELVNHRFAGYYSEFQAQNFAFEVWSHNAFLTGQCLAAGVLILPVFYLLWENAFGVGMTGGVMISAGRADTFFGLIMPHGLLELTCVYIAAGFGLRIGWAWIAPGKHRTRGRALAETAREGMLVALGLCGVLAVSGFLEAFVTPAPLPAVVRVGFGALVWASFLVYVVVFGRRAARAGQETDLDDRLGLAEASVPTA